jgi:uncharacterized SAM-binding protein YcdF (DUF218 family)
MFFYLSQFLSFLVMPLTLVILLFLCGMILLHKRVGKKLLWLGVALLLFFSNVYLANYAMYLWEPDFKAMDGLPEYEIGIVLTGVTNLNKTAYDRTFFNKGADRATHAMQLYKLGKIRKILITGGQGLNPTNPNAEADLLANFMVVAGVPKKDILIENKAVNTRENALFTRDMLEAGGFDLQSEAILITSAFHMKRSKACFDRVGIPTVTFPVDYYASDPQLTFKSLIQPSPDALKNWHILVKEWVGLAAYKAAGYI